MVLNTQDSGSGSLRDIIAGASDGDTIVFDPSLVGQTITLTSGELVISHTLDIEGPGADQLAISGNDHSRVFDVTGEGTLTIAGLTITHGLADNGGGIKNTGTLTLESCTVSDNQALGAAGNRAQGGGVFNTGTLTAQDSAFSANLVMGGPRLGATSTNGQGGGLASDLGATTTVSQCTFSDNRAIGGAGVAGVAGSNAGGAGFWNANSSLLTVSYTTFRHNQAVGGAGGTGADGGSTYGGGLQQNSALSGTVAFCTFTDNETVGGPGGDGGVGGDGAGAGLVMLAVVSDASLTVSDSSFSHNSAIGGGQRWRRRGRCSRQRLWGRLDRNAYRQPRYVYGQSVGGRRWRRTCRRWRHQRWLRARCHRQHFYRQPDQGW
jgi:hypothetical protein